MHDYHMQAELASAVANEAERQGICHSLSAGTNIRYES